jgi:hypothetical protein
MKRLVPVLALAVVAACGGSSGHAKSAFNSATTTTPTTYTPIYTPPPTTVPPISTLAEACAKLHSVTTIGRDAVVAALPQLRAVFAGVPSDTGPPYVVTPGVDDGTQLQEMLIWCFGHNDGA